MQQDDPPSKRGERCQQDDCESQGSEMADVLRSILLLGTLFYHGKAVSCIIKKSTVAKNQQLLRNRIHRSQTSCSAIIARAGQVSFQAPAARFLSRSFCSRRPMDQRCVHMLRRAYSLCGQADPCLRAAEPPEPPSLRAW